MRLRIPPAARFRSWSSSPAAKGLAFGGGLHFDEAATAGHDHVHIDFGAGIFLIAEIQHGVAENDAYAGGGDGIGEGDRAQDSRGDHALEGQRERDVGSGDGGGARAAIGLNDVAIEPDGALAELLLVGYGAKRAADEAGNFESAAGLAATRGFASGALLGGPRQHAVLGRDPALTGAFQKRRHAVVERGGADDAGLTDLDQDAAFGDRHKIRRHLYRAQLVPGASVRSQASSSRSNRAIDSVGSVPGVDGPVNTEGQHED